MILCHIDNEKGSREIANYAVIWWILRKNLIEWPEK